MSGQVRVNKEKGVIDEFQTDSSWEVSSPNTPMMNIATYIPPLFPKRPPASPAVTKSVSTPKTVNLDIRLAKK